MSIRRRGWILGGRPKDGGVDDTGNWTFADVKHQHVATVAGEDLTLTHYHRLTEPGHTHDVTLSSGTRCQEVPA